MKGISGRSLPTATSWTIPSETKAPITYPVFSPPRLSQRTRRRLICRRRRFQRSFLIARQTNPRAIRAVRLTSATVEFAFAPEERDVYSYERTPKDLAPLGAKPGGGTFARAGKSDCAPALKINAPCGHTKPTPTFRQRSKE